MRLSEAIELGSLNTKQIRGIFSDGRDGACALGAACIGSGVDAMDLTGCSNYTGIKEKFPILNLVLDAPVHEGNDGRGRLMSYILWLNDVSLWPRPKIAAWVRSIEDSLEPVIETVVKKKETVTI